MRVTALGLLAVLLVVAGWLLWQSSWSFAAQDRTAVGSAVTRSHVAGTDELGRDRGVRMAAALLLGMAGAVAASALASAISVGLGAAAAFAPPALGRTVLYAGDLFLTLPWLFLLMMVRAALPLNLPAAQSAGLTFLLLGVLGAPAFLRVHYTALRRLRRADWMLYGRAAGLSDAQRLRGLLPHVRPMLLTQFLLYIPATLMAEANLGTLGLGLSEPLPSWGSMLGSLQNAVFLSNSRLIYLPVLLMVVVLMLLELMVFESREVPR